MTAGTKGAPRKSAPLSVSSLLLRIVGLMFIDAIALMFGYGLWFGGLALGAIVVVVAGLAVSTLTGGRKAAMPE